jgi:C_GCAxxG_C_C family probable redox protein
MVNTVELKKYADEKMGDGCNCCEAVVWGYLVNCQDEPVPEELLKAATIFGGGVATSREEICGALSGILMVLSLQAGRTDCVVSNDKLMEQGRMLRTAFIEKIGPTKCIALREKLDNETGTINCKKVVQDCIELLDLIELKS